MKKIFISYSWKNEKLVKLIYQQLIQTHFSEDDIFFDRTSIGSGFQRLPDFLKDQIQICEVFLLIWSQEAANAPLAWVYNEITFAKDLKKKLFICSINGIKPPDEFNTIVPYQLEIQQDENNEGDISNPNNDQIRDFCRYLSDFYKKYIQKDKSVNPFIFKHPVTNEAFIGRKQEINTIKSNILNNQSTAFLGSPGFGGTSLLLYIENPANFELFQPSDQSFIFFPIYFDLSNLDNSKKFSPDVFRKELKARLWQKYRDTMNEQSIQKPEISVDSIDEILWRLAQMHIKIVLLLDKLQFLYEASKQTTGEIPIDFHNELRALATSRDYSLVIFCTSDQLLAEMNENSGASDGIWYSPLINIFSLDYLEGLTLNDLHEINSKILGDYPFKFSKNDLKLINQITAGVPVLVQIASSEIFKFRLVNDWHQALSSQNQKVLFKKTYKAADSYLKQLWDIFSPDERSILMDIVITHHGGKSDKDMDLLGYGGCRAKRLEAFQIVSQNEKTARFEILSPLFKEWIHRTEDSGNAKT